MKYFADFTSHYVFHHIPEVCPLNIHVISNHSHNLEQHCKASNKLSAKGRQFGESVFALGDKTKLQLQFPFPPPQSNFGKKILLSVESPFHHYLIINTSSLLVNF